VHHGLIKLLIVDTLKRRQLYITWDMFIRSLVKETISSTLPTEEFPHGIDVVMGLVVEDHPHVLDIVSNIVDLVSIAVEENNPSSRRKQRRIIITYPQPNQEPKLKIPKDAEEGTSM
jgi:hypothetical protein